MAETDLAALMRESRLLCALSTAEGFGLPVVEAMFSGLPVLASDIPPFREVAGKAAVFVAPHDEAAITHQLRALLADDGHRRQLADLGLGRRVMFSWEAAATEVAAVIRRAVGEADS